MNKSAKAKAARLRASQAIYDLTQMLGSLEAGIRYRPIPSGAVLAYQRLVGPTSPQIKELHESLKQLLEYADDEPSAPEVKQDASALPSIGDDAEFKERLYRYAVAFAADSGRDESYEVSNRYRGNLITYIHARTPPVAAAPQPDVSARDAKQLAQWLLRSPDSERLVFAGPLEPFGLGLSQVKMMSASGAVWTLVAGLREGYKPEAERNANLLRIVKDELSAAAPESAEPSAPTEGYLIEWHDTHGKRRKVSGHNSAGDFRAMGYENVTATELVRRLATSSAAKGAK